MQQYEIVIVLTPLLSVDAANEANAKFSKILTDNGAEIIQEDNWGLKKLAYPIQKKTTGYYHLTEFKAPGELINKLEIELRRDERVLRFLTIALDKHAVAYNEKKRSGAFNKKPAKAEEAAQ
ncbi:MAG: 30S ribosomal protein S6 [Mucilaginibacter sp.]|uniref:30S ribosomal protein S6 n=1 Tax=Mucilaginibacter sp. L3T2-6 TaxID=3062491 RepID=UPI002676DFE7|nr:30S ribosomal protein S6 [Mucilaginibacter sp. L3T2-6]MDO3641578.1 30S ribosomal protein S6 [Mucilaginibacter sp. L3T2-6]MDV6214072.1 30S ribosomal protein S6 [Mucilaginibacter sp. L3T2-6]